MGNIEVEILEEPNVETEILDLNYIPDYQVYEAERQANEVIRQSNEETRKANELLRQSNETTRQSQESTRVSQETGRVSAESSRVTAENGRVSAEDARVLAEQGRVAAEEAREAVINSLATVATTGSYSDLIDEPTKVSDFTNDLGFIDKNANNLTYYTLATGTGSTIELSINSSTYVMTLNLKNAAGTTISTGSVDLPLESVVVSGSYNSQTKKVVLTLQNGSTIEFSVADLIDGLQSEITSSNKLSSDLVDDTNQTNKFVTAAQKTIIDSVKTDYAHTLVLSYNQQTSEITTGISNYNGNVLDYGTIDISGKEDKTNKTTALSSSSTNTQYPGAKCVYDALQTKVDDVQLDGTSIVTNHVANALTTGYSTDNKLITEKDYQRAMSIYNVLPKVNGTGENISLDNTGVAPLNMELKGNTSQVSYTGKNLLKLDFVNPPSSIGEMPFTYTDNSFTLKGTATSSWSIIALNYNINIVSGETYTFSANVTGTNPQMQVRVRAYDNNNTVLFATAISKTNNYTQSDTASFSGVIDHCTFTIESLINGESYDLVVSNIQLEKSSSKTDFEPYVGGIPSPNPSYPQPIQVVSGDNSVVVCGKNLLNPTSITDNYNYTYNSKTGEFTGTTGKWTNYDLLEFDTPEYITFSYYGDNAKGIGFAFVYENGANNTIYPWSYTENITYTPVSKVKKIRSVTGTSNENSTFKIQIEHGQTSTPFVLYQSQTYPISLGNLELCKIGDYKDKFFKAINGNTIYDNLDSTIKNTLDYGEWYLEKNIGKVVLDGSENWNKSSKTTINRYFLNSIISTILNFDTIDLISNYFVCITQSQSDYDNIGLAKLNANGLMVNFDLSNTDFDTLQKFTTWLSTHNTIVYYVLATPTNTEITNTTLINQLNAIEYAMSYQTQTNISQSNNDLPFIMDAETLRDINEWSE